jgi:hypothetical protein
MDSPNPEALPRADAPDDEQDDKDRQQVETDVVT